MGISKVIFFLHCTCLALSSCVFAGAYNFDTCNHTSIRLDYQHLLKKTIKNELDKTCTPNIIDCCPQTKPENLTRTALFLACIHAFTAKCAAQHFQLTKGMLLARCDAQPAKNGTQNVEISFRESKKCIRQRGKNKCGSQALCELKKMWSHYEYSFTNTDMKP